MGLYIKGMDMPTNDELLYIKIYPNGKVAIDMDLECKQIATAVSVPPHGRLIDADELLEVAYRIRLDSRERIEQMIERAPTVDAVPVVRCKDCIHLEILNGSTYYARCRWHGRLFESFGRADTRTWFCADGERRTDNA